MKKLHAIQIDYLGGDDYGSFTIRIKDLYHDEQKKYGFVVYEIDTPISFILDVLKQHFEIFSISANGDDSYIITTDNFDNVIKLMNKGAR